MERRGRLTYERLCNSFERLHGAIQLQFPHRKDRARAQDLQRAIDDALISARAGVSGAMHTSPFQLKREVEARIVAIHERHETGKRKEQVKNTVDGGSKDVRFPPSTPSDVHTSLNDMIQKNPAPRHSMRSPDSGKENATPSQQHGIKTPPAVKKTAITKRATSKKPPSTTTIATGTNPSPRPNDDADRRAAATALLNLSEHHPSLPPTLAPPIPTTKKRTLALSTTANTHPAPPPKRRFAPATHVLPRLEARELADQGFRRGVEYAVRWLDEGGDGAALLRFLETGFGGGMASGEGGGDVQCSVGGGGGGARRGFWDVV